MSARHVNADTPMVGCAIIPEGCCPWCRQPLTTDDRLAAVRVGHELLHSACGEAWAAEQSDAALVFGTRYEAEQRRIAK